MPHLYPTPASLLWTAISFLFIVYSLRALHLFVPALRKARRFTFNGRRKRVAIDLAKDYVIGESVRLLSHVLSAIIGVQSLFVPPIRGNNPLDRLHALYSGEVLIVLILLNVLSGANSMRAVRSWLRRDGIIRGHDVEGILARIERLRARQVVERDRQTREGARQTAEGARQTAEGARQTVEGERLRQIDQRQESERQTVEGDRQTVEGVRQTEEGKRQTLERGRADEHDHTAGSG